MFPARTKRGRRDLSRAIFVFLVCQSLPHILNILLIFFLVFFNIIFLVPLKAKGFRAFSFYFLLLPNRLNEKKTASLRPETKEKVLHLKFFVFVFVFFSMKRKSMKNYRFIKFMLINHDGMTADAGGGYPAG